jgi:hypothetical protein
MIPIEYNRFEMIEKVRINPLAEAVKHELDKMHDEEGFFVAIKIADNRDVFDPYYEVNTSEDFQYGLHEFQMLGVYVLAGKQK